jgi:triacylglycerol esterase/lipase EstA (alpha/beta hydrolase family)
MASVTHRPQWKSALMLLAFLLLAPSMVGCTSQRYLQPRRTPVNPLTDALSLMNRSGPQPTGRTISLLRHYDVLDLFHHNPELALENLQRVAADEKGAEKTYAISELAYILGIRYQRSGNPGKALDMYSVAVSNAYLYLFSPELDGFRNPYDPQFRGACDLYNTSLEAVLRIVSSEGNLRPGLSYRISTDSASHDVRVANRGPWSDDDFGELKFCSDFQVKTIDAGNVTYGIGVPMLAVRKRPENETAAEQYYPEGLSFPVTAILRVTTSPNQAPSSGASEDPATCRHPCVLELHDPLSAAELGLNERLVPIQSDLSTPLAHFLENPRFKEQTNSTTGLLFPDQSQKLRGVYMLEPFDPNRIPVLMVHGLWSSPMTWMPMFNDLRSFRELRKNYQFWFYQYPTGQPFWISASQMRADLAELRRNIDPNAQSPVLDQMVLVGHSMGGLVSRMQTIESGEEFWRILSDASFDQLRASEEEKKRLASVLFFHPNPSIQRVVTIATPHRGSDYANDYTQWLGKKLIQLPSGVIEVTNSLIRQNPDIFRDTELLITKTSIDSLNPDSPIFPVLLRSRRAPWVHYHNIIGMIENSSWFSKDTMESDGIVSFASAQMEDAQTQIVVQANHGSVHTTPRAILEVRRILIEHLKEACQKPQLAECLNLPEPWKKIHQQTPKRSTGYLDWPVRSAAVELPLEGRLESGQVGLHSWIPGKTIR